MPDFYLDYILSYPGDLRQATVSLEEVARKGGGNLLGWKHVIGRGGNTANLVAQLSILGVEVVPIIETDQLGYAILEKSLGGVDLTHVKTKGSMSSTLSLEADYSGRRVNIMMSNPASHAYFGPEKLSDEDKELIRGSDFVVVLNWSQNQRGTDLAEVVFKTARRGRGVTFFDPGDSSFRSKDISELNRRVLGSGLVDVLSVNENELLQLSKLAPAKTMEEEELLSDAEKLSKLSCRVDLHTPEFSASIVSGHRDRVPCLKIEPAKVTGAGDVWNAASIYAQGMGLQAPERLLFANAAAATYLGSEDLNPLGLEEILANAEKLEQSIERSRR